MIAVIVMASIVTGVIVGWLLTMIIATAVISRSQERMQRKVRHWQAETARARAWADRLSQQAAAQGDSPQRDEPSSVG